MGGGNHNLYVDMGRYNYNNCYNYPQKKSTLLWNNEKKKERRKTNYASRINERIYRKSLFHNII